MTTTLPLATDRDVILAVHRACETATTGIDDYYMLEDAVREADFMVAGARVANVNIGLSPWVAFGDSSGRVAVVKGEERKGTRPGPHASGFTGGVFEA